jgi:hypothetical protein
MDFKKLKTMSKFIELTWRLSKKDETTTLVNVATIANIIEHEKGTRIFFNFSVSGSQYFITVKEDYKTVTDLVK